MMKQFMTIAAATVLSASLIGCSAPAQNAKDAKNGYKQQRVVYHVNNLNTAFGALRNVKNHVNAVGAENAEIIVVTHSSGGLALVDGTADAKGNRFEESIQALANQGVKFQLCSNTIRGLKIDKDKINLNAEVVPSGVAHVAHLQQQGYLYVKP